MGGYFGAGGNRNKSKLVSDPWAAVPLVAPPINLAFLICVEGWPGRPKRVLTRPLRVDSEIN